MIRPTLVFVGGWGYAADALSGIAHCLAGFCEAQILTVDELYDPDADPGSEAFLPALCARLDRVRAPVVLAGWSFGGQLALAAAARRPHRIARLVLIGATPRFVAGPGDPPGTPRAGLRALRIALRRDAAAAVSAFRARAAGPNTQAPVAAWRVPGTAALEAGLEALETTDLRSVVERRIPPLDVLHGDADAVVPFEASVWMRERGGGRLTRVEGGAHDLPVSDPAHVAGYLARVSAGAPSLFACTPAV